VIRVFALGWLSFAFSVVGPLHCIACGNMHGFVKLSVQLTDRRAPWRPAKEDIGLDSPRNNKKVAE
jgi:hypothetical protein